MTEVTVSTSFTDVFAKGSETMSYVLQNRGALKEGWSTALTYTSSAVVPEGGDEALGVFKNYMLTFDLLTYSWVLVHPLMSLSSSMERKEEDGYVRGRMIYDYFTRTAYEVSEPEPHGDVYVKYLDRAKLTFEHAEGDSKYVVTWDGGEEHSQLWTISVDENGAVTAAEFKYDAYGPFTLDVSTWSWTGKEMSSVQVKNALGEGGCDEAIKALWNKIMNVMDDALTNIKAELAKPGTPFPSQMIAPVLALSEMMNEVHTDLVENNSTMKEATKDKLLLDRMNISQTVSDLSDAYNKHVENTDGLVKLNDADRQHIGSLLGAMNNLFANETKMALARFNTLKPVTTTTSTDTNALPNAEMVALQTRQLELEKNIKDLQAKIAELEAARSAQSAEEARLNAELAAAKKNANSVKSAKNAATAAAEKNAEGQKANVAALTAELAKVVDSIQKTEGELQAARDDKVKMNAQLAAAQSEIAALKNALASSQASKTSTEGAGAELNAQLAAARAEKAGLKTQLDACESSSAELKAQLAALRAEFTALQTRAALEMQQMQQQAQGQQDQQASRVKAESDLATAKTRLEAAEAALVEKNKEVESGKAVVAESVQVQEKLQKATAELEKQKEAAKYSSAFVKLWKDTLESIKSLFPEPVPPLPPSSGNPIGKDGAAESKRNGLIKKNERKGYLTQSTLFAFFTHVHMLQSLSKAFAQTDLGTGMSDIKDKVVNWMHNVLKDTDVAAAKDERFKKIASIAKKELKTNDGFMKLFSEVTKSDPGYISVPLIAAAKKKGVEKGSKSVAPLDAWAILLKEINNHIATLPQI